MLPHISVTNRSHLQGAHRLQNTLYMSSSTAAPRRWLRIVAETCRSINKTKHCVVQLVGNKFVYMLQRSRDSSVGIATLYGLEGPGIESRWGARFSAPVQTGPGAYPAFYIMGTGSFLGEKRPGRGVDHPPHLAPRLKKEYSYTSTSPLGLSWPVLG